MNTLRPSGPSVNTLASPHHAAQVEHLGWSRRLYFAFGQHKRDWAAMGPLQGDAPCMCSRNSCRVARALVATGRAIARGHARELALAPWRDAVGEVQR